MTPADPKNSSDEDLIKDRGQLAAKPRSKQGFGSDLDSISTVRHLDVDTVLERSLRKVVE